MNSTVGETGIGSVCLWGRLSAGLRQFIMISDFDVRDFGRFVCRFCLPRNAAGEMQVYHVDAMEFE